MSKVALVRCPNYNAELVDAAVNKAIDLLGGIESIIKPNSKVLIKPNLLTDSQPQECITTHPRVVESVIRIIKKTNAEIFVGDSPSVIGEKRNIDTVYEVTGIKKVCQRQKVNLIYFEKPVLKNGIPLTDWIERCDYIINVPKFKTHNLTVLTAAVKNLFGLVSGMHKAKIHRDCLDVNTFSKRIVDILGIVKPALTIVDAIVALEGEGPASAGTKTDTELVLASQDAVSIDSILAVIMGLFPKDVPTTKEAVSRNLGESDIEKIDIAGDNLGEFIYSHFKLPKASFIYNLPKPIVGLAKFFAWHRMQVLQKECKLCQRCINACPVGTIRFEENRVVINNKNCILCSCCLEVCPHSAIKVAKSLLLKILGV